jgi:putative SOS response-associated peptidase YedK
MCGRFGLHHSWQTTSSFLYEQFKVEFDETKLSLPLYNIAPTQSILILIHDGAQYRVGLSSWGFSLSSTNPKPVINARSESVFETTLFRQSIRTKRCLILASGFYEWQRSTTPSQPNWFYDQNKPFLVIAGLYQTILSKHDQKLVQCAMLTTGANEVMKPIHDRVPVMLNQDQYQHWVHPKTPIDELKFLFKPTNFIGLNHYEVSTHVNKVANQDAICLEPIKNRGH